MDLRAGVFGGPHGLWPRYRSGSRLNEAGRGRRSEREKERRKKKADATTYGEQEELRVTRPPEEKRKKVRVFRYCREQEESLV